MRLLVALSALNEEVLRSQQNLRRVSDETGGFAVVNTGEFAHAFERVVEENSEYYLLGYYSTNPNRDGQLPNTTAALNTTNARKPWIVQFSHRGRERYESNDTHNHTTSASHTSANA